MIPPTKTQPYFVYILECSDHSYYTGLTSDLLKRFEEHINGDFQNCYTFNKRPLTLRYYETIPFLQEAVDRETQIKGWSRAKKKALIEANFHKLQLLSQCNNFSHHKYRDIEADNNTSALSTSLGTDVNPSTPLRADTSTPLRADTSTPLRADTSTPLKVGIL
ncbi:MAG TPA: GIY-YIG nuclease family protein, partial [Ferruginibacter sp.]|nr:GIY-YIG nuclease family protein [Ferruginibacter sp.]